MAGDTHEVDIGGADLLPPWSTVFEVVAVTDVADWILVGGLMVQLHAYRAAIPPSRITKDVDVVVDVVAGRTSIQTVAGQLQSIGFSAEVPNARNTPAHRYIRNREQVDLMVPADLPAHVKPRLMTRPAMGVPAGKQAIARRDRFVVRSATQTMTLHAPDVLGAIIGKGAAYEIDQRDPGRHLEDAALLLASITAVGQLDLSSLSKSDRKHLTRIAGALPVRAAAWRELDHRHRLRGQRQLARLVQAAGLLVAADLA